ncbi:hypothetical protein BC567DRAFT_265352 [Phyllosticta citribraziliensis]
MAARVVQRLLPPEQRIARAHGGGGQPPRRPNKDNGRDKGHYVERDRRPYQPSQGACYRCGQRKHVGWRRCTRECYHCHTGEHVGRECPQIPRGNWGEYYGGGIQKNPNDDHHRGVLRGRSQSPLRSERGRSMSPVLRHRSPVLRPRSPDDRDRQIQDLWAALGEEQRERELDRRRLQAANDVLAVRLGRLEVFMHVLANGNANDNANPDADADADDHQPE